MNQPFPKWRVFAAAFACLVGLGLMSFANRSANVSADTESNWGFNLNNLDRSCKPCQDFYKFAMGGWMKNNPIPPEYSIWGTFTELARKNQNSLRQVLETAEKANAPEGSNEQKIGDLYASCMDTSLLSLKYLD